MKNIKIILLLVFIASVFSGCKKEVLEVNPDFIGEWKSCGTCYTLINIQENSSGYWFESGQSEECLGANVSGTFKLSKDKLKLKGYTFKVIEEPALFDSLYVNYCVDGKLYIYNAWTMKLKDPKIYGGDVHVYFKQ